MVQTKIFNIFHINKMSVEMVVTVVAIILFAGAGNTVESLRLYKDFDDNGGSGGGGGSISGVGGVSSGSSDEFNIDNYQKIRKVENPIGGGGVGGIGGNSGRGGGDINVNAGKLQEDINDFIALIPITEVKSKINEFYKKDTDVHYILNFINGKEFLPLKKSIFDVRKVKEFETYFSSMGLNIKEIFYKLDDILGVSKLRQQHQQQQLQQNRNGENGEREGSLLSTETSIGGLYGLLEDILGLLPQDEIFILFFEKLESSRAFSNMVELIGSQEFTIKFDSLKKSKEVKKLVTELHKRKIDLNKLIELLQSFFLFGTF